MAREDDIRARCEKATPGPWVAKRTTDREEVRCDGIAPACHNHEGDNCYDYDRPGFTACPATNEIVTTDSGYYGPSMDDAEFIAHAREDIPYLLQRIAELEGQ